MDALVCFALKEEAAPFQKVAAGKPNMSVLITGIGRKNAGKSVREFLAGGVSVPASRRPGASPNRLAGTLAPPELVLTCGFAGGLNPELKVGDVVFEPSTFNPQFPSRLVAAGAKSAKFFCANRIAVTAAEKKKLRADTGADAVEMESAAIHAVCAERGIPCMTVRVISDAAEEDLPLDFNALAKPDQSLDYGKLAWAIATSPGKIGALMQLQKKTGFAAQRLAELLGKVIA